MLCAIPEVFLKDAAVATIYEKGYENLLYPSVPHKLPSTLETATPAPSAHQ